MWNYLLHRLFGISPEGHERIRIGGGVVINTTHVMLGLCAAAVGIAWALAQSPSYALAIMGTLALIVLAFLIGTWLFANRNPDQAAMGGSEWRRFRESQLAAKNQPQLPPAPSITDPLQAPPPSVPLLDAPEEK